MRVSPRRPDQPAPAVSAADLCALIDYVPEIYLFAKDDKHRFTLANSALWKLHNCASESAMLGKTDFDFHPPVLARQYVEEDRRIMQTGQPLPNQIWLVPGADGAPRWYLSSKVPLRGGRGQMRGIAGVMRPYDHAGGAPDPYRRLTPAIEHVLVNYGDPITVADLARLAGLSMSQFQRDFRRLFGMAPRDYIWKVRLQVALRRLESSAASLGAVAIDSGFYDQSHFIKRFKAATGLLPLQHRRRFGNVGAQGLSEPLPEPTGRRRSSP